MILMPTYETHIYVSEAGYLVIKQIDGHGDELSIILSKDQAALVADELECLCAIEDWSGADESSPASTIK